MSTEPYIKVKSISKYYESWRAPSDRLLIPCYRRIAQLLNVAKPVIGVGAEKINQHYSRYHEKALRSFNALNDISFDIKPGDTFGIVGVNGSGKSTLLQIIAGTLAPSSGNVDIHGRVAALLELGSGFNPEFTGKENVYLNATILGLKKEEIDAKYNDIVNFADIGDFMDQPVKTYSSGMVVRLAFSVIVHIEASILIVDEALAVGDVFFVQKCMAFLHDFKKKGILLFVSHDLGAVTSLCNKAIWLDRGRIVKFGSAKDVAEKYMEHSFTGSSIDSHDLKENIVEKPKSNNQEKKIVRAVVSEDPRKKILHESTLKNEINIFKFKEGDQFFGDMVGEIDKVILLSDKGHELNWMTGGEVVSLVVHIKGHKKIISPIVGFFIKNKMGQHLFGDNSYLTFKDRDIELLSNQSLSITFKFQFPILPKGDYTICASLSSGTQENHVHHHWVHDIVMLKSLSDSVCTGLVGVPMVDILIDSKESDDSN